MVVLDTQSEVRLDGMFRFILDVGRRLIFDHHRPFFLCYDEGDRLNEITTVVI